MSGNQVSINKLKNSKKKKNCYVVQKETNTSFMLNKYIHCLSKSIQHKYVWQEKEREHTYIRLLFLINATRAFWRGNCTIQILTVFIHTHISFVIFNTADQLFG